MTEQTAPTHPGQYLREEALKPRKLTVTDAAKLVGVGRQAFSAFLNSRTSVTPEMAARIEVAFEVPVQELLRMQAAFDAFEARASGMGASARRHVVALLAPKARDIEDWVERNIAGRTRLSVFLRTLVNSTTADLARVAFPGNDDAERPGWDGWTETNAPNAWVAAGKAGWEFGTNANVSTKANEDYAKSVKAMPAAAERAEITFVFVTPRQWPQKAAWVKAMAAKKQWRDVRAYDSSDLEQWIEQSVPAQAWFAAERNDASIGTQSLDKCWNEWTGAAAGKLPSQLFDAALQAGKRTLEEWAASAPTRPLVIAADSTDEALAFLARTFSEKTSPALGRLRDKCVVFVKPGALSRVAAGVKDFIAIVSNREVERELGPHGSTIRSIVTVPRNSVAGTVDIVLQPLTSEAFEKAFEGVSGRDEVQRLARESGRSLTVLRRRLATVHAIRMPAWAEDKELAARLVPFLFAGAWNSQNAADREVLCRLTNVESYEVVEQRAQDVVTMHDAPMWSVGALRGVVSKMDLLFATATSITTPAMQRFFEAAALVMGEDDPRLDLPDADRWAAAMHNKKRKYSEGLRDGIAETVVLLAIHGENLMEHRTGFDCAEAAAMLVRNVLTPLTARRLEANEGDLPAYAEAAPEEFLDILEADLRKAVPESFGILRNIVTPFSSCARSGLLWSLESLAWNEKTLRRVVLILGKLATVEITDNWVNKPISSLYSIFSTWMPQTAASHEIRVRTLQLLADKFPGVAWQVCLKITDGTDLTGHYSYKPRWRNDGNGHGEPFEFMAPIFEFRRAAADILLGWKHELSVEMICDLVGALHNYDDVCREKVWATISAWAARASDADKAIVREKVRVSILTKRAARRPKEGDWAALSATARAVYTALESADVVQRHQWLFRDHWIAESADEINSDCGDFAGRDERITKLRTAALKDVWREGGVADLRRIAAGGNAAHTVGTIIARHLLDASDVTGLLVAVFSESASDLYLMEGALAALDVTVRDAVLAGLHAQLSLENYLIALVHAPFTVGTWKLADTLTPEMQRRYWTEVQPWRAMDGELEEAVNRLLAAARPLAAFSIAKYESKHLGPDLLYRVLLAIAQGSSEEAEPYRVDKHWVQKAFAVIDASTAISLEAKASLEFAFVEALADRAGSRNASQLTNLERYVEQRPEFYVQAVAWTYRRKDGKNDPTELQVPPERKAALSGRSHRMLHGMTRLPGYGQGTELRYDLLIEWVRQVRARATEIGRLAVADVCIGTLLTAAPAGADGVWPCEPVRQVLEDIQSEPMIRGISTGRFNMRGAHWRGRGGDQERSIADDYRKAAGALEYSHPFVATALLANLAQQYERIGKHEDTDELVSQRLH